MRKVPTRCRLILSKNSSFCRRPNRLFPWRAIQRPKSQAFWQFACQPRDSIGAYLTSLDSLPQVKFWIRHVARHPQSFWLPTASAEFYPDFVAQLDDGRFFVVEYKGALLAGADVDDTDEKRAIGRLWESRSGCSS